LWDAGQEGCAQACNLRALARRFQEGGQVLGQELHIVSGAILKDKSESSRGANSRIAGGEKLKAIAAGNLLNSRFRCALIA